MRITGARANRALPVAVRKLVAGERTSTTALAADTELVLSLQANTNYLVTGGLRLQGGDSAGDFQYAWAWSGTMTVIPQGIGPVDTIATGTSGSAQFASAAVDSSTPTAAISYAVTATGVTADISAWVEVGATAGDLTLWWAQLSSSAFTTFLQTGSWLNAQPVQFN